MGTQRVTQEDIPGRARHLVLKLGMEIGALTKHHQTKTTTGDSHSYRCTKVCPLLSTEILVELQQKPNIF